MLVLSEDQKLLMESARAAVAAKAPVSEFRKLRAEPQGHGFSRDFWRECAELGWRAICAQIAMQQSCLLLFSSRVGRKTREK